MSGETQNNTVGPIVSSAHLASGALPALSEVEFAMTLAGNAFQRWIVRCMAAAGEAELGALDVLVLHVVNHRGRAKKLADLCLMLNIEDTHTVAYALKKLEKRRLIRSTRAGKEKVVEITPPGEAVCARYRDIREACLVSGIVASGIEAQRLSEIAGLMRTLAGHYDQAARAAASL
ncbi:Predicted transcription regulator, contains HTH domain (MarR family) [hydrothermal vent metagenome]|uniref:Predicted transcription regulator, contains HTH domain (MarR family) n=1 Tax=hydrothermal vent metagenome TaxID=652676 RepID=A0A3B0T0G0_9ZZZZ